MNKVKIKIRGKTREITIQDMVCRNCEHRYMLKHCPATRVLNCKQYPAGKPYEVLKTNRCEQYRPQ